jgi:hypothetical protein
VEPAPAIGIVINQPIFREFMPVGKQGSGGFM